MDLPTQQCVPIYALTADGVKFKLRLPLNLLKSTVKELKTFVLHSKQFPIECQALFLCESRTHLKPLNDDAPIPSLDNIDGSKSTLHLYITKSAQQRSLEKTPQSDFDQWLKELKRTGTSALYTGVKPAVTGAATGDAPVPARRRSNMAPISTPTEAPPPEINGHTSFTTVPVPTYESIPPAPPDYGAIAATVAAGGVSANAVEQGGAVGVPVDNTPVPAAPKLLKHYNSTSDFCQLCSRVNKKIRPTHYCFSCEENKCVLCENCANEHFKDATDHVIEMLQTEEIPLPDAAFARVLHQTINHEVATQWRCDMCTVMNKAENIVCVMCDHRRPGFEDQREMPVQVPDGHWRCETCTMINENQHRNCAACDGKQPGEPVVEEVLLTEARWQCTVCTYLNLPYRPSCYQCTADRPADYQVPDDYQAKEEERRFIDGQIASDMALQEALAEEGRREAEARERNRQLLLNMDDQNLIQYGEEFECPICFVECEPGEGVKLRECLHVFCKDCLKGHIESSENPEVKCPFVDDEYHCDEVMQEREIREIAPDFYPKLLEKGLQVAESQAADSFHCKSINCPGWCTYDEDVNFFACPVCRVRNCITCQAIHENQNCKEYQDDLKRKAEIDVEAKKTQDELERLLRTGEAMKCPKCAIVIMKKTGCDWIKCSVCKTEICWVTKQARWGPKGHGDTSGGCRCGVNGKRCAPNCGNCH